MVYDGNLDDLPRGAQHARYREILRAGHRVSGRMVVRKDDRYRPIFDGARKGLPRMDLRLVHEPEREFVDRLTGFTLPPRM